MKESLLVSRFMRSDLILLIFWFIWFPLGVLCSTGNSSSSSKSSSSLNPKVINIGALSTLDSVIGGATKPALEAAIDDVNSDPNTLDGIELKLILHDTKCSGFIGTMGVYISPKMMIIRMRMEYICVKLVGVATFLRRRDILVKDKSRHQSLSYGRLDTTKLLVVLIKFVKSLPK